MSFKYPGQEYYALRNVSFRIEPGQLCVSPTISYTRINGDIFSVGYRRHERVWQEHYLEVNLTNL